jgi:4-hydroxy-3-methylbut-2-en-1-yl diphosphate reductase
MIVKRAAVMGRCMGVKRAVDLALAAAAAEAAAAKEGPRGVLTLGPLIHNPQAVAELEAAGVRELSETRLEAEAERAEAATTPESPRFLEGPRYLEGRTVVLRAHGVPPARREQLLALGARLVDATCPRVLASQRKAASYAAKGWKVVIAGDRGHGEVTGIAGYAPGAAVVGGPEEASRVFGSPSESLGSDGRILPIALIAQTTIKKEEYEAIRAVLAERFPVLEVVDSICPCTQDRLDALAELAAEVEAIVIVGGRNSANTARLISTAKALGKAAWLVETAAELPAEAFGFSKVGLSAGASTPERLIDEVEEALLLGR